MPGGATVLSGFMRGLSPVLVQRMQQDRMRDQQLADTDARNKALAMMEQKKYEQETYDPATAAFLGNLKPEDIPPGMGRMQPSTLEALIKRRDAKSSLGTVGDLADATWKPHLTPAMAALPIKDEASARFYSSPYGLQADMNKARLEKMDRLPVAEVEKLSDRQEGLANLERLKTTVEENKDVMGPVAGRVMSMRATMGDTHPDVIRAQKTQGLYNDVRQAIGKAKEGGVLRKEDEIKYEKILGSGFLTYEGAKEILASLGDRYAEDYGRRTGNLSDVGYRVPKKFTEFPAALKAKGKKMAPPAAPAPTMTEEQRQARIAELEAKKGQ